MGNVTHGHLGAFHGILTNPLTHFKTKNTNQFGGPNPTKDTATTGYMGLPPFLFGWGAQLKKTKTKNIATLEDGIPQDGGKPEPRAPGMTPASGLVTGSFQRLVPGGSCASCRSFGA